MPVTLAEKFWIAEKFYTLVAGCCKVMTKKENNKEFQN